MCRWQFFQLIEAAGLTFTGREATLLSDTELSANPTRIRLSRTKAINCQPDASVVLDDEKYPKVLFLDTVIDNLRFDGTFKKVPRRRVTAHRNKDIDQAWPNCGPPAYFCGPWTFFLFLRAKFSIYKS